MLDHTIRMVLNDRLNNTSAVSMANDGSYAANEKDEDKAKPETPQSQCGTVPPGELQSHGVTPEATFPTDPWSTRRLVKNIT